MRGDGVTAAATFPCRALDLLVQLSLTEPFETGYTETMLLVAVYHAQLLAEDDRYDDAVSLLHELTRMHHSLGQWEVEMHMLAFLAQLHYDRGTALLTCCL